MIKLPFGLFRKRAQPRIAIVGTCQTGGMAAAARGMLPGAEVQSWHISVWPTDTDEEILAKMPDFDLVISQVSDWDSRESLRISRLREMGLNVVYTPSIGFTGFHPDITYMAGPDGYIQGEGSDYHSILIAAAFVLGIPEHRVADLFNTYVFAELGYLDVFPAAKAALVDSFAAEGFEIESLFDDWLRVCGPFMYSVNHPHVHVLATITRLALSRAGYVDAAERLPKGLDDYLSKNFTVPTYPPIAKRVGVPGSTVHNLNTHGVAPGQKRGVALGDYVSASYRIYRDLDRDVLMTSGVAAACERLDSLVVR